MQFLLTLVFTMVATTASAKLSDAGAQVAGTSDVANKTCGEVVVAKLPRLDKPGTSLDELGDAEVDMLKQDLGDDCFAGLNKFKSKQQNQTKLSMYYEGGGSIMVCGLMSCWVTQTWQ